MQSVPFQVYFGSKQTKIESHNDFMNFAINFIYEKHVKKLDEIKYADMGRKRKKKRGNTKKNLLFARKVRTLHEDEVSKLKRKKRTPLNSGSDDDSAYNSNESD